jgi:hypothetical protein
MDDRPIKFVGLDVGAMLTLAGIWTEPAGERPGSAEASWPVRARIEGLRATAEKGPDEIRGLIRELCAQHGSRPEECLLVRLGQTPAGQASALATGLGICGVIEPQRRLVLWSEGVLPAREVKEYVHSLPPVHADDLDRLRACFADLMEQAAQDVQTMVLDQDDTVLDRYVDARYQGTTGVLTVPVESLTDPARLLAPFHAIQAGTFTTETRRHGEENKMLFSVCSGSRLGRPHCLRGDNAPVEIVAARLRCIILT